MVDVIHLHPDDPLIVERHVAVIIHRDGSPPGYDKGYFYDSAGNDHGGSGPFDWRMDEAIERATRFAAQNGIGKVVVRARLR